MATIYLYLQMITTVICVLRDDSTNLQSDAVGEPPESGPAPPTDDYFIWRVDHELSEFDRLTVIGGLEC